MNSPTSIVTNSVSNKKMANAIRALSMDAVQRANSGHPGAPMGMADIVTVLFTKHLKYDSDSPNWPDRDRLILSNGHASMLLYSLLYLTGYDDMTLDQLKNFRKLGSRTAGHPEYGHASGIETTTGPLGQGLANAVGMALGERIKNERLGNDLIDHFTYVLVGVGCLMEGISHEAISLAGHLKLSKLIVMFDDNNISIDGSTDLSVSDDQVARFAASGWDVLSIDGHNYESIDEALTMAKQSDRPTMIACKTKIGFGSPNKEGSASAHGSPLGDDEINVTRDNLDWPHKPFDVPSEILSAWRAAGSRGKSELKIWQEKFSSLDEIKRAEFEEMLSDKVPNDINKYIIDHKRQVSNEKPKWATRKSSEEILKVLTKQMPNLIGGSADLTGSNNTKTDSTIPISADKYGGSYIYYGVREHAMAAIMNGLALHGGFIPYGGTFLTFTDYCRPSIRLAALMGLRVIYVMTHDSIGLGEDGPTHQPVEHISSLRAMPNLNLFRPADPIETAECWQLALESTSTPSVLALTRQGLPTLRETHTERNMCALGAYVIEPAEGNGDERQATILATGSEVEIAIAARKILQLEGIATAVVSMPCWELFDKQPKSYREEVLGRVGVRVAVEASVTFGWSRYGVDEFKVVGMQSFGASAPLSDVYSHFGITTEAVVNAVRSEL